MKIKDNFWLGLLLGAACFGLTFLLLYFINWESLGIFAKRAPFHGKAMRLWQRELLPVIQSYITKW